MRQRIPVLLLVLVFACKGQQSSPPTKTQAANPPVSASTQAPATTTESAVAPEVSPVGDIPDTQAFVKYSSAAGGYELDVPEGWARTENGPAVTFVNKIDGVKVTVAPASSAPTASSVQAGEAKQIQSQGRAVTVANVSEISLPGGKAVLIKYGSNSDPNAVTNKQVRLDNEAYVFFKNGKEAILTLWAPQGADNVDQWQRMSKSFRWL